jgi:hypothetical protein
LETLSFDLKQLQVTTLSFIDLNSSAMQESLGLRDRAI